MGQVFQLQRWLYVCHALTIQGATTFNITTSSITTPSKNDTKHKGLICDTQHNVTVNINDTQNNNALLLQCHYSECHILFIIMLNVIMLNVVMLSAAVPCTVYQYGLTQSRKLGLTTLDRPKDMIMGDRGLLPPPHVGTRYLYVNQKRGQT